MNFDRLFEEVLREGNPEEVSNGKNIFGNEGDDEGPDGPYMNKQQILAFFQNELKNGYGFSVWEESWNDYHSGPDSILVLAPGWRRPIIHFIDEGDKPDQYTLKGYMQMFFEDYDDDEGIVNYKKNKRIIYILENMNNCLLFYTVIRKGIIAKLYTVEEAFAAFNQNTPR